jgi:hypothetical protein
MSPTLIAGGIAVVLAGICIAEGVAIGGKNETIAAKTREVETITKDRDAQAAGLVQAQGEIQNLHGQVDTLDRQARASQQHQQAAARELAVKLAAATDEKNALFAELEEKIDVRPIVVSQTAADGWDPVVVAGMRRLKCLQLTAAGHPDAADCRVSDPGDAGRSGAAGDPAGAPYPRPDARQQLDFLAFAWRLREWGASCYDDKRAIAAAQTLQALP